VSNPMRTIRAASKSIQSAKFIEIIRDTGGGELGHCGHCEI
jgi:hypothetical protein